MLENIYNFTLKTFVYLKKCMANNIFVDLLSLKFLIFSLIYICNVFLNIQNALDPNIFLKIFRGKLPEHKCRSTYSQYML